MSNTIQKSLLHIAVIYMNILLLKLFMDQES